MAKEYTPHSNSRKGFTSFTSLGVNNIANPLWTGGDQPGMIELKDINGGRWYLWAETDGTLKISSTVDTIPTAETQGEEVGGQS